MHKLDNKGLIPLLVVVIITVALIIVLAYIRVKENQG